jgi:GTP-binding protein
MGRQAAFTVSASGIDNCPREKFPEYAFVGRSNVGKSSLINLLAGFKNMARTSSAPGKTRLINFYEFDSSWYLVDLPGYGYARTAKTKRTDWDHMVQNYLLKRKSLMYTFVLIDARLEPQKNDLKLLDWIGEHGVPFCIVFTKADKISKNQVQSSIARFKKALNEKWEELPPIFITSSLSGQGKSEILNFIHETNAEYSVQMHPVITDSAHTGFI